jgi:hypothetical protein
MDGFGYPDLMRAGLGNMMYPWARCFIWCRKEGAAMLAPRWFKLRLGPYVRREADKRRYDRLFTSNGYVTGMKRARVLARGSIRGEHESKLPSDARPEVVRFSGLDGYFLPLYGQNVAVRAELLRITKPALRPSRSNEPFVAVHVRCGDFSDEMRQPQEWYVSAVRAIRSEIGDIAVRLYSDGSADELRPLLELSGLDFIEGRSAVTDLLAMAEARVIVASSSTFSMWSSFLGDVPSIWYPGRMWQSPTADPESHIEWDGVAGLPASFTRRAAMDL